MMCHPVSVGSLLYRGTSPAYEVNLNVDLVYCQVNFSQVMRTPRKTTLGQRIQIARTYAGEATPHDKMTQEAFAERVGECLGRKTVGKVTISRWEQGKAVPTLESLLAIAKAGTVDPGWLAFGDESQAPPPERFFPRDFFEELPAALQSLPEELRAGALAKILRAKFGLPGGDD